MKPEQLPALIVGCGNIAGGYNEPGDKAVLTHAVAYRRLGAPIVACCDSDAARAEEFARKWSIPLWGDDLSALLEQSQPAVVSVCTPPDHHWEPAEKAFACPSVRAVLLEKPMADSDEDSVKIVNLPFKETKDVKIPHQAGTKLLVNYCRAFDPFYVAIEKLCRSGALGKFCGGTARYYGSARSNASHFIERALAFFGHERIHVSAYYLDGRCPETSFKMSWDGAALTFLPSPGCAYAPFELDLLFETARLHIIDSERRVEWFEARPDPHFKGYFNLEPAPPRVPGQPSPEAMLNAVAATLRAAEGDGAYDELVLRAYDVMEILDKVA